MAAWAASFSPRAAPTAVVTYKDAEGKRRTSTKGLSLATKDNVGRALSGDGYAKMIERVMDKAKRLWNELDQSTEERFKLQRDGPPA